MADARKSIDIDVNLDSKTAQANLKNVGTAAKEASDQVDKLDGTKVAINTSDAKRDIDGLITKVERLDSRPAQILLRSNAESIATDMAQLVQDIDRLDANDPQVQIKVDRVNELSGDLDKITGKLKELDDTKVTIDTTLPRQNIDGITKSADSSKSALANMVGNSAQDIGQLSGVSGSAGVAIGQMAEYMADARFAGEGLGSVLRSFALVGGPILGLSVGLAVLPALLDAISGGADQAEEDTKALTKAFEELENATPDERMQAIAEVLEDVLKDSPRLVGLFDDLGIKGKDVADTMKGETAPAVKRVQDEFTALTGEVAKTALQLQKEAAQHKVNLGGWEANEQALGRVAEAHGLTKQELENRLKVEGEVVDRIGALTEGTKRATEEDNLRRDVMGNLVATTEEAVEANENLEEAQRAAAEQAEAQRQALADLDDQLHANTTTTYDAEEAQIRANQALRDYGQKAADASLSTEDQRLALLDVTQQLIDTAAKQGEAATANRDFATETDKASTAIDAQIGYLEAVKNTLAPNDPLRANLQAYIDQLNGIKANINTEVTANTEEALRKLREVQSYLLSIGNTYSAYVEVAGFATGGVVPGPPGKPRMVLAHGGEQILPGTGTSSMSAQGGGGGGTTVVNQVTNVAVDRLNSDRDLQDLMNKLDRRWARWTGTSTVRQL